MGNARTAQKITRFLQGTTHFLGAGDRAMAVAVDRTEDNVSTFDDLDQPLLALAHIAIVS
jgi:hypothetical protein